MKLTCTLLFLLASLLVFGQKKNIKGVVLDEETGTAVPFARVELTNFSPTKSAIADEAGRFEFPLLSEGKHKVKISALEYQTDSEGWDTSSEFWELKINKSEPSPNDNTIEKRFSTPISTASSNFEKLSDAPGTVYVVTSDDIQTKGYQYLTEVLADLPEIEVNERSDQGSYSTITMRGKAGNIKMLVLLNGMRLNSAASSPYFLDKNFPVRFVKRIEVLIGPASALYGADAVSGVINIITEKGRNIHSVKAQAGFGMYMSSDNFLQAGYGNRDFSVAVNANFARSREPFLPNYYPQEYDWYLNHYSLYGSMRTFAGPNDTVILPIKPFYNREQAYSVQVDLEYKNLELSFFRNNQQFPSAAGELPDFNPYIQDAILSRTLNNLQLHHKLKSKRYNRWNLSSILHYNRASYDNSSVFVNVFSGYNPAYKYGFNNNFRWLENFNYNFNPKHRISAGLQAQYTYALPPSSDLPFQYEVGRPASEQNFYYLGTDIVGSNGESLRIAQDFYFMEQLNGGAFAQYQANINDKLFITTGARLDYGRRRLIQDPTQTFNFITFNPRAGAVYKPKENLSFKLFYGESFLASSPENLYTHFGSFVPLRDSVGNFAGYTSFFFRLPTPDLQPEKFRSLEFNSNIIRRNFSLTAIAHLNQANNLLSETYRNDVLFKGVEIQTVLGAVNNSTFYSYGGALRLDYRQSFGLRQDKSLSAYLSYNYSDGRVNDSLFLFLNAMHHIKAGLTWQQKRLSVHIRALYRSGSYNEDQFKTRGFLVFSGYLNYRVLLPASKKYHLDLFVKGENITDRRYYHATIGATLIDQSPQNPIFISAGFSAQLHTEKSKRQSK